MFGFTLNKKPGFDASQYTTPAYDPNQFASVATPQPVEQKTPTVSAPPQQAMQSYAVPVDNESEIYKGISKDEEEKLLKYTNGDSFKAMEIYPAILQNKQDKAFLEDRKKMLAQAQYAMTQNPDKTLAGHTNNMVKISQFADFIRETEMKKGAIGVSQKSDDDLMGIIMTQSPLGQQGAKDILGKYLNGSIDVEQAHSLLIHGEPLQKVEPTTSAGGTILGNAIGGLYKSAAATTELGGKIGDWIGYKVIQGLYGKEEADRVAKKMEGTSATEAVDDLLKRAGVDSGSAEFKILKTIGDVAQVAAPSGIETKIAGIAEKAPIIGKVAKMATEGALSTQKASLVSDQNLASGKEMLMGAGLNAGLGIAGDLASKGLKAAGNKLQLSGLINPQKLEYVQKALREDGDQVDNVTEWMSARNLVGSKKNIVSKLKDEAKKTYTAVRDAVKSADDVVGPIQDESVGGALEELLNVTAGVKSPQKKAVYDKLLQLQQQHATVGLKPSEIQSVKDSLDEMMSIYTLAGDTKAGVQKADLADLRSNIRGLLENKVGESVGVDIASLNRDTAVAHKLAEGIMKKDNAESIRELLSPFAPSAIGGIYGGYQGDTPEEKVMYAIAGMLFGKLSSSTTIKTGLGQGLKSASKIKIPMKSAISGIVSNGIVGQDQNKQ